MSTICVFDTGKTGCRAAVWRGEEQLAHAEGPGAVGITDPGGLTQAVARMRAVRDALAVDPAVLSDADVVVAGVAGLWSAPDRASALRDGLAALFPGARVIVTSDAVTSHAGALSGRPGVVLAAGTGVSVVALSPAGELSLVDGAGYLLGDAGSGYAIGRAGLDLALLPAAGREGSAALLARARARWGDPRGLPRAVQGAPNPAKEVASFARDVFEAAREDDVVARRLCEDAGRELATSVAAAVARAGLEHPVRVATTGGLLNAGKVLVEPFERHLDRLVPGATRQDAEGDALCGGLLLALDPDLPHLRAQPPMRGTTVSDTGLEQQLATLETERSRPGVRLDEMEIGDLVAAQLDHDRVIPAALDAAADQVSAALEAIVPRLRSGGRMLYVGAGTPGRLAILDAAECLPTFGVGPDVIGAVIAGGDRAQAQAVEGAEDDEELGARDIETEGIGAGDVVVGISASGRTPYVLAAMAAARARGAVTVAVANTADSALAAAVDHPIEVLTGPEFVTGSTRLKAGTAQKCVLNMLSTISMIALGKVYGTLMVDVVATNEKLRVRARRIVMEATGADAETADAALREADGHAKTAIAALLLGVSTGEARQRLEAAAGSLGVALEDRS